MSVLCCLLALVSKEFAVHLALDACDQKAVLHVLYDSGKLYAQSAIKIINQSGVSHLPLPPSCLTCIVRSELGRMIPPWGHGVNRNLFEISSLNLKFDFDSNKNEGSSGSGSTG
jgi:hypothetical protein